VAIILTECSAVFLLFRQNNRATRKKYNIMQQIDVLKISKISVVQIKLFYSNYTYFKTIFEGRKIVRPFQQQKSITDFTGIF
jgi:hypothetical protein